MSPTQRLRHYALLVTFAFLCHASQTIAQDAQPRPVEFNREILPILSDHCFQCHGPDGQQREAALRLDQRDGLFAVRNGQSIVMAGDPDQSLLFARVSSTDSSERMPPENSGLALTPEQIRVIRNWIAQGAVWQPHWAFVAPNRPLPPNVQDNSWCLGTVDRFVLARLEAEGLAPAPPTDRATLLRRATLDLTGLPPTPREVDDFLEDLSPAAYERVVDRLLASPRFGERMALGWLDLARYADTSGYQNDGPRSMWRWREWVIESLNADMPFDRFTIAQMAGDLLPGPNPQHLYGEDRLDDPARLRQLIATGFHRNHRGNAEGGIIPEEFQVEYVVDRVETTATTWLGLTLGCARCHDHKYDPFSQRDFYQLFAFFNNVPEYGRAIKEGNSPPYIQAPTDLQLAELRRCDQRVNDAMQRWNQLAERLDAEQAAWEKTLDQHGHTDWAPTTGLVTYFPLDQPPLVEPGPPEPVQAESAPTEQLKDPEFRPGRFSRSLRCDGDLAVTLGDVAHFGYFDRFSFSFWVAPESDGTLISRMTPVSEGDGYAFHLQQGRLQVNFVKRWLDDSIRVETEEILPREGWHHIGVTYDGTRRASGIAVYVDGRKLRLRVLHDFLNQSFTSDQPLRLGAGHAPFRGLIDELRIYQRQLTAEEVAALATPQPIQELAQLPTQRTPGQAAKLRAYYLEHHAPAEIRAAFQEWNESRYELTTLLDTIPTVMVMRELGSPRPTHILKRGQYDQLGEPVSMATPSALPPLPPDAPPNRLGLARWLIDPANPLTARVAVNRYWQNFFGQGLVTTPEDFGVQGARPTHPELLDWLATEFVRSGWDLKWICRTIVLSATYRQSSQVDAAALERDPDNALLARGPRFRLPAEMIRDQALAASGLLVERLGGPSVKIYQPDGLWLEIASDTTYDLAQGADLYRRSLYSYWKRTVSPPAMATFDAPSRETCLARRPLTNTPLQALAVMNDVTYVEAARALAERAIHEIHADLEARLIHMFRLVAARSPSPRELAILRRGWETYYERFRTDPQAALALIRTGQHPNGNALNPAELAAYTLVASLILNLDESLTKE